MASPARPLRAVAFVCFYLAVCPFAVAQVNVTTYHNENARTGQNTQETILMTSNVRVGSFGKLFSVAMDGQVYAQPLVLSNVSIGGGTHNVVYVATENDSVYAIDANSGTVYWQESLIMNGGGPIPDGFSAFGTVPAWNNNISPHYGITGTPVIDPATNTIYVLASTDESGFAYHRLHALDVTSGAEKFGGPVVISGSYEGQTFNGNAEFNRPALLLQSGHIIVAFGQPCDACTFGWVFSYNATTLAQEAAFCVNPGTAAGTIWMSGDGVATDSSGNLYFANGNGSYDGSDEFGDTIMQLGLPSNGAFSILDWFTPNIQQEEAENDWDQGSGGVLILPDLGSGSHPHLLVQAGKTGTIYLVDRTTGNMGKWCGTVDNGSETCTDLDVQEILPNNTAYNEYGIQPNPSGITGVWGSPAYWNGNVYFPSANKDVGTISDYMQVYSFNAGGSGVLSAQPTSHTPQKFNWPGPNPTVSSNGTTNGIVWATDNSNSSLQVLHSFDATNLAIELYSSGNACRPQDQLGGSIKFSVPTVANGKVYIGGSTQLNVFGLLTSVDDFCVTALPSSQTVNPGERTTYAISVTAIGSFIGTVSLTDNCRSIGLTCSLSPSSVAGSGESILTVTAPTRGRFPASADIIVTGTSGSLQHSVTVVLNVQ